MSLITELIEARRMVLILTMLLEDYTKPHRMPMDKRTDTVVETLAESKAWLKKNGVTL